MVSARFVLGALVLGIAAALFVPALAEAAGAIPYSSYEYGEQLRFIGDNAALILACVAILLLALPFGGDA